MIISYLYVVKYFRVYLYYKVIVLFISGLVSFYNFLKGRKVNFIVD